MKLMFNFNKKIIYFVFLIILSSQCNSGEIDNTYGLFFNHDWTVNYSRERWKRSVDCNLNECLEPNESIFFHGNLNTKPGDHLLFQIKDKNGVISNNFGVTTKNIQWGIDQKSNKYLEYYVGHFYDIIDITHATPPKRTICISAIKYKGILNHTSPPPSCQISLRSVAFVLTGNEIALECQRENLIYWDIVDG
ncbi:MAG: hypothetical protein AAGH65_06170, partial [Pseudomonadota bacterium]